MPGASIISSVDLKNFDIRLTEWQNMQLNGYDRIWDCGNLKFMWENKSFFVTGDYL